jgi:hypothetical protein
VDRSIIIAWAVAIVVVILQLHGLWRFASPNHRFIFDLIREKGGETDGNDT